MCSFLCSLSRYPFQLGHHSVADHPSTAQMFDAVLEEGDLVVMGSDGVFDNLTDSEILAEAFRHVSLHQEEQEEQEEQEGQKGQEGQGKVEGSGGGQGGKKEARQSSSSPGLRKVAGDIASSLADLSFWKSVDKSAETPFSMSASEAFDVVYSGGKKDDITIIVCLVAPNSSRSRGKNYDEDDTENYFQG